MSGRKAVIGGHRTCVICGVKERKLKGETLVFAQFPLNENRCKAWLKAVGNEELVYLPIEKLHQLKHVCSKHFNKKDYNRKGNRLKKYAVPTINLTAIPLTDAQMNELGFPQHIWTDNDSTGKKYTNPSSELTPRKKKLLKKLENYKRTLKSFRQKIKILDRIQSPALKTLLQSAVKNQNRRPRGRRWSDSMKGLVLAIYKKSPKVYRYLKLLMPLPSERTLQSILHRVPMEPGFNDLVLSYLKKRAGTMNDKDKICVLLFDEMSIKKRLIYNPHSDKIEGYQDLGSHGRAGNIADKVLVFMLQGIHKKIKQPLAHFFVKGTISSEKLVVLIKEAIIKICEAGFRVIATVCDQGPTNVGAINLLKQFSGLTAEDNYFIVEGSKYFIIYDVPHLFKNIRNNFMQAGQLMYDGRKARWSHLREVSEKNTSTLHFKKISPLHVAPSYRTKMKVKLAAQILSNTVKAILLLLAETYSDDQETDGTLKRDSIAQTAYVIGELDRLFDCTNGPASRKDIKKGIRENVSENSYHHRIWQEYKRKISTIDFLKSDSHIRLSNVRCIKGFNITLGSLEDVWKLVKNMGFKYLNLRQLNQDSLENLFGIIRQHCPTNQNPTCSHFTAALKSTILTRLNTPLRGSNCENDENQLILDFHDLVFKCSAAEDSVDNEHDYGTSCDIQGDIMEVDDESPIFHIPDDEESVPREQTFEGFEKQPIVYVSGYLASVLIKRTNCTQCLNSLRTVSPENKDIYRFIALKEWWDSKQSLIYPTVELCSTVETAVELFEQEIKPCLYRSDIGKYFRLMMSTKIDCSWICKIHMNEITNQLLLKITSLLITNECKKVNRLLNENEQSCADYLKKCQAQGNAK